MKRIVVFIMMIFLVFSINGFSQDKTHKKVQSGKIEQSRKGNARTKHLPGKSVSKKIVHKSVPKGHKQKKSGNSVKL